ncbi:MAG: hypothetical protein HY717_23675 [Planctomycetes bacterium]|nr:hypothetical protein [Planctomycetota bacterium]
MEEEKLSLLKADLSGQLKLIDAVFKKIARRKKGYAKNPQALESLAYQLHNLYCAFEDLFKIVADHFENQVSGRNRWHQELMSRMKVDLPGIRPALVSESAFECLNELLRFRHVFRHAYGFELEAPKLKLVLQKAQILKKIYKQDIPRFLKRLGGK